MKAVQAVARATMQDRLDMNESASTGVKRIF